MALPLQPAYCDPSTPGMGRENGNTQKSNISVQAQKHIPITIPGIQKLSAIFPQTGEGEVPTVPGKKRFSWNVTASRVFEEMVQSHAFFSWNGKASRVFHEMAQRHALFMKRCSVMLFPWKGTASRVFFNEMAQRHAIFMKRYIVTLFPWNGTASCVFHEIVHHEWMKIYIWRVKTSIQNHACSQLWCFFMKQNIITLFSDDKQFKNRFTKRNRNRVLREISASSLWLDPWYRVLQNRLKDKYDDIYVALHYMR